MYNIKTLIMKKILLYSVSTILILVLGGYLYITLTPPVSPLDTSSFVENEKEITITYSQPFKKGRLISVKNQLAH